MSEEQDKKANQVSDDASVKNDVPAEPAALADDELTAVAGGLGSTHTLLGVDISPPSTIINAYNATPFLVRTP